MGMDPEQAHEEDAPFTPLEVLQQIKERNLHRIIGGYRRNKVYNWKEICDYSFARIEAVLERTVDVVLKRIGMVMPQAASSLADREEQRSEAALARAEVISCHYTHTHTHTHMTGHCVLSAVTTHAYVLITLFHPFPLCATLHPFPLTRPTLSAIMTATITITITITLYIYIYIYIYI
jgi:hypothetical protein